VLFIILGAWTRDNRVGSNLNPGPDINV
jgi:hypothetical protein